MTDDRERLAFGFGIGNQAGAAADGIAVRDAGAEAGDEPERADLAPARRRRERRDWPFVGLMVFTGVLYFRPQDVFTPLRMLHLAELAAIFALGALLAGRLGRGLPVTRMTTELAGVLALGFVILATAPFSFWMGGAVATFTDLYVKVLLIFVLMVNTLTTRKRIEQFTLLIVVASGYIAGRAVLDYARGINLIENGRVQGAVGGMFKNPNDLALNLVAVLPLAAFLALRRDRPFERSTAAIAGVLMIGAIIATQSRSGTVGLAAMVVVLAIYVARRMPALVFAGALAGLSALPLLPSSYWERMASITDEELDQTGSREAREILLREAFEAFKENPLTGVGAGNFAAYDPDGRQEPWRESHNAVLQVAAELGVFGLIAFGFLLWRAFHGPIQTRRLLRAQTARHRGRQPAGADALAPGDHEALYMHAAALSAALVGWFVCALFASVAYHWTFYYLLALAVAPRDYVLARLRAARGAGAPGPSAVRAAAPLGAHA